MPKRFGGGYCRLQMPLSLALGVRGTVAGHWLGRRGGGGGSGSPSNAPLVMIPDQATGIVPGGLVLVVLLTKGPCRARAQCRSPSEGLRTAVPCPRPPARERASAAPFAAAAARPVPQSLSVEPLSRVHVPVLWCRGPPAAQAPRRTFPGAASRFCIGLPASQWSWGGRGLVVGGRGAGAGGPPPSEGPVRGLVHAPPPPVASLQMGPCSTPCGTPSRVGCCRPRFCTPPG